MEGSPVWRSEQHLPRVLVLKHSTSPIILVPSLGMGEKMLLVGGGCDVPLNYTPLLAGCQVLVNTWCSLVTFIMHLKQKVQVPPEGEETWGPWGGRAEGPTPGCRLPSLFPFLPSNHCSSG